ncbi:Dipeptidyl aminopeptidase/acylaminoacyl peptidase [Bacteroidales bacterium WCE2004]|nr:Dipeptidyl aminopeptidase/acylaminoacyl peptidase [Bacteroidales bacterium WCE2004]
MKRIAVLLLTLFAGLSALGARPTRVKPNYDLASQFSQKRISQMVFSTTLQPNWFRDSDKFWYEWKTPAGTEYWIVDPETGRKSQAFDMEKLAMEITATVRDPFDAQHLPIENLELKDDRYFRFDIKSTQEVPDTLAARRAARDKKGGDKKDSEPKMTKKVFHFQYDITTGKLSEYKPEKKEYPAWASVSPDGQTGVYVKNANLYWMDRENLAKAAEDDKDSTLVEHRLTADGVREFGWGGDNYMGDQETDTTRRVRAGSVVWSPDSKHFVAVKTDMRDIKELWVINALSQPRPTLETYKYQMPGEPGPKEELYVFSMPDGSNKRYRVNAFKDQVTDVSLRPRKFRETYDKYRSRVWLGDNDGFYLTRGSRDLHRIDVCRVDLAGDSTRTIISERMNTYVEERQIRPLAGGKQLLWWSERNGWANLYLYNADGTLVRNLTEGAYHVEDVLEVNEKEGYVLFAACGVNKDENPYQMHTYRVSLSGGPIRQLDMDDMNVEATASDDGRWVVGNCSRVDYAPEAWLIGRDGKRTLLEKADLSLLYAAGYKMPERFKVKAADGVTDLYGAMYKPFDFDSTKVYPIIDYVYPGPQVEANNIEWSRGMVRTDRLAQVGFIVITVGNRGGHPNRSKWYHNYGYGNLRDYGLEDQKYAIQQLAGKYDFIDGSRVGIHGHSGGGFMSTAAILKYPDFFKAAVSCAGNHDNSIYNRWWSETHHGVTEKVAQSDTSFVYHIETNPEIAANLKGHLMLVHGDIDNNVNPANTIRVVNALIRANKRFDLLILPGQRHGFGDMNEYFFYRLADYFSEWLLGDSERDEVDIKELNND